MADSYEEQECAFDAIETGKPSKWKPGGWIVHGPYGRQRNKDTPSKWFRRFVREHKYGKMTFHDLRHAHASILAAHNIDIAAIAARMGHSDPSVTLANYIAPLTARDAAAATALDELLSPLLVPQDPDPDLPA